MGLRLGKPRMPTLDELKDLVNTATASLTNDYNPQESMKYPEPRRAISRFLLTLAIGGILLAMITIMAMTQPNVKVSRVDYDLEEFLEISKNEKKTIMCPCLNQSGINWTKFIKFSMRAGRKQGSKDWNTTPIDFTMFKATCANEKLKKNGTLLAWRRCYDIVSVLFSTSDRRNRIQTTNLLSYPLLLEQAPLQMTSKILQTLQVDNLIRVEDNEVEYYETQRSIAISFAIMINQFKWKPSSSDGNFWRAVMRLYGNGSEWNPYLFKMDINWTAYARGCNPQYCDVIERAPIRSKVFHAMVDVGGFSSVVLFVLKTFLWPILKLIFQLPSKPEKEESNKVTSTRDTLRT